MQLKDVIWVYHLAETHGITIWIDGGWGIDALLERETRQHGDLDIVVEDQSVALLLELLRQQGFQQRNDPDHRDWNFVLFDPSSREIDVHVVTLDENGNGIYGPVENNESYPSSALTGRGQLGPLNVRCISADYQLASHDAGYPLRPQDLQDVKALCKAFDLDMPERFRLALKERD